MKITIETAWKPKGSRDREKERESAQAFIMLIWKLPFIIIKELWEVGNKWIKK